LGFLFYCREQEKAEAIVKVFLVVFVVEIFSVAGNCG
jgi:hypothetical protein